MEYNYALRMKVERCKGETYFHIKTYKTRKEAIEEAKKMNLNKIRIGKCTSEDHYYIIENETLELKKDPK